MPKNKQQIIENLQEDLWDWETTTAVVQAKRERKNLKGESMSLFVLKTDHPQNENELHKFLDKLQENIENLTDGTRMQLLVQSCEHWYPMDIEVRNGNLSVLIPEAGFSPATSNAARQILNRFPNADIYRFYPEEVTIQGKKRTLMIQSDGESCSRFALQQLYSLQQNPLMHRQLHQSQSKLKTEFLETKPENTGKHYSISFTDCPTELASAFKSTQSVSALGVTSKSLKEEVVNKKGETLEEYHRRHTRKNPKDHSKVQNLGIMDFKDAQIQSTESFLTEVAESQVQAFLSTNSRTGFDFLTKGQQFRENHELDQRRMRNHSVVADKKERVEFLQKVNQFCRSEIQLFDKVIEVATDPKIKQSAIRLREQLETVRSEFMTRPHSSGSYLGDTCKSLVDRVNQLDFELRKLQYYFSNQIDLKDSKPAEALLKELNQMTKHSSHSSKPTQTTVFDTMRDTIAFLRASDENKDIMKSLKDFMSKEKDSRVIEKINSIYRAFMNNTDKQKLSTSLLDLQDTLGTRLRDPKMLSGIIDKVSVVDMVIPPKK